MFDDRIGHRSKRQVGFARQDDLEFAGRAGQGVDRLLIIARVNGVDSRLRFIESGNRFTSRVPSCA